MVVVHLIKKIVRKVAILLFICVPTVVIYFVGARTTTEQETTICASMDEPALPLVYT